jgi:TonB C terminal
MDKFLPFILLFLSSTCFSETITIPGCAPDTVEKWQAKVYSEFRRKSRDHKVLEKMREKTFTYTAARHTDGVVHIWIEKRGVIINQEISQSSNSEFYDQLTLEAIAASTLPSLDCSTNRILELSFFFNP